MSSVESLISPPTKHAGLLRWVEEMVELCEPESIVWCNGSDQEWSQLCEQMVRQGTLIRLNPEKHPNSFLARSVPSDVARLEDRTYICSQREVDAGPTNNWHPPQAMRAKLKSKFKGSMRGRTLYVVPFCMGPLDSPLALLGVEITDSPYVVVNMKIMCHMGDRVWEKLQEEVEFLPCLHSVASFSNRAVMFC